MCVCTCVRDEKGNHTSQEQCITYTDMSTYMPCADNTQCQSKQTHIGELIETLGGGGTHKQKGNTCITVWTEQ